jgi:perosamine synthetase
MPVRRIPVYEPVLGAGARQNVLECLDTNWISSRGKFVDQFEREFAAFVGTEHAASVCNGTVALHLALLALDVGPGDEVIVPTFTYVASVNAITYVGATPVFVDSHASTWQLSPEDVARKVTSRTKAIIVVHLYGQPAQLDAILSIAREHKLAVVEDCAEAIGSRFGERHVGTFGDVATWSFFGNKTITTGEGGMVTCADASLDARVRKLKGQGLAGKREYWHDVVGYNYRMTNICAAIGTGQLHEAARFLRRKREIAALYCRALGDAPVDVLGEAPGTTNSYWMNCIAVRDADEREPLRRYLADQGVETRPGFYPVHTMPMYTAFDKGPYPQATRIAACAINLPSSPALTDEDVRYVASRIGAYFDRQN